jgi:aspartate aminotransferase-like enzyme
MRSRQYLMIPGPMPVPDEILQEMAAPMINHRGPDFTPIIQELTGNLKKIFLTEGEVFILTSSGTGALEASVVNFLTPGDAVLVPSTGFFGERYADLASAYGAKVEKMEHPWGAPVDIEQLAARLKEDREGRIKAILFTHNESSTAVMNDLKAASEARGDHPALLITDAVSSLGALELRMDAWGVDVVASASQKALLTPPGIAFIAVGPRAREAMKTAKMPRYYYDLNMAREYLEKNQTSFTPALSQFRALRLALRAILEKGLENIFRGQVAIARSVKNAVKALGLDLLADERCASYTVTAVKAPEGIKSEEIVKRLREKYGIVIGGGQGPLAGKIFRIGHMGAISRMDLLATFGGLTAVLRELGYALPCEEAGGRALDAILSEG